MSTALHELDHYCVPTSVAEAELVVQRSRFLAIASPIQSRDQAHEFLQAQRALHHKATHHCSAARLGHPEEAEAWSSDDGEPSGSAGMPMLREIQGSGLSDLQVICVRWFGGIKLGTGGLARAYADTARLALQSLTRDTRVVRLPLRVRMPWSALTRVKRLMSELHALELSTQAAEDLVLELAVPRSLVTRCREDLELILQGKGEIL